MRLEPRVQSSVWIGLSAPAAAVACALLLSAVFVLWAGANVAEAYGLIFKGAFGSMFGFTETLARSTPLIFTGLAAAVAFRCRFWNIGAEGQFYVGALTATLLGTGALNLPSFFLIPVLAIGGAIMGGLILLLPALLKSKYAVDEVVTTLLLNFIILLFVSYLLEGPLKDPMSLGWPQAKPVVEDAVLPLIFAKGRLHLGFMIAIAMAVLFWLLMSRTALGYEIRAVGDNPRAAAFAGIGVNSTVLKIALLSGGVAGLGGVCEVIGLKGYLTLDLSPGFGYTGIAVAMLALLHPLGAVASAIFISAIFVGADSMGRVLNIPSYFADVTVAACILFVLVGLLFVRYRIVWK